MRSPSFFASRFHLSFLVAAMSVAATIAAPDTAHACGCFAPPDVSQPLLQAGEEILFVVDNGKVTMHVKIRYSGRAGDFGWLLPLPSVPINSQGMQGIDIGTDELFQQLETRTQPTYVLRRAPCIRPFSRGGGGSYAGGGGGCGSDDLYEAAMDAPEQFGVADAGALPPPSPLIKQDSVGPFDYAILKADDKSAMLQWLSMNNYVVPAGTDGAVNAYIRPGAYFLALRLRAGAAAGDLQPVVLSYPSDLPMIPIVLTSVGASPNMGILVWVLGSARAIPRNYASAVINDAKLDWLNQIKNYNDVVIQAVSEAPGKHAFVTEFAGDRVIMQGVLDSPGRFNVLQSVRNQRDPVVFIEMLKPQIQTEFGVSSATQISRVVSGFAQNGQFFSVVGAHIPMPQQLVREGVTPDLYYNGLDYYLNSDRARRPSAYMDIAAKLAAFDPMALYKDLNDRIAAPTLREGALFALPGLTWLTRLYTTLSPEDMNADPVFSMNPELGPLGNQHNALLDQSACNGGGVLTTDSGFTQTYTQDEINRSVFKPGSFPASQRIERLLETGAPEVMTDNTQLIRDALHEDAQGCATTETRGRGSAAPFLGLCAAGMLVLLLRRRRLLG